MKHKVVVEVEVPEGWEPTGEFRIPEYGENYWRAEKVYCRGKWVEGLCKPFIILRKSAPAPAAGQVWANREGNYTVGEYLLVKLPAASGPFQALSLSGEGGYWRYPEATPAKAVEGLTFVRERLF